MRRLSLLLALAATLVSTSAGANGRSREEEAKTHFDAGLRSIQEGRFADAIAPLRKSLSEKPRPATAFNLAVALRGTGQLVEASVVFDQVLHGDYGDLSASQRAEVRTLRDQTEADVAVLSVHIVGPKDYDARLDGEVLLNDTRRVNPGAHRLVVSARDHRTEERAIQLEKGEKRSLSVTLAPASDARPGTLVVESKDPLAVLTIVGVARARSPLSRTVPPGRYTLVLEREGEKRTVQATVPPGRTIRILLDPPGGPFFTKTWFWLAAGSTLAAAGGVTAAILLTREKPRTVEADPTWGVTTVSFGGGLP